MTYAEFVWNRSQEGYTHDEISPMLGWSSVDKVDDYKALRKIHPDAWKVIPATFAGFVGNDDDGVAGSKPATAGFTPGLLRSILDLTREQQLELVTELATNKDFSKGKFKTLAENYIYHTTTKPPGRWRLVAVV